MRGAGAEKAVVDGQTRVDEVEMDGRPDEYPTNLLGGSRNFVLVVGGGVGGRKVD